jgi:hypothetical protein
MKLSPDMGLHSQSNQWFARPYNLQDKQVAFYVRRPVVLWLLSVGSFGLYNIYWFYRNWQSVQKESSRKISPFWRALLTILFVLPLFSIILAKAEERGYSTQYSAPWLSGGYIIAPFLVPLAVSQSKFAWWHAAVLQLIVSAVMAACITMVQRAARAAMPVALEQVRPNYWAEAGFVVLGLLLVAVSLLAASI